MSGELVCPSIYCPSLSASIGSLPLSPSLSLPTYILSLFVSLFLFSFSVYVVLYLSLFSLASFPFYILFNLIYVHSFPSLIYFIFIISSSSSHSLLFIRFQIFLSPFRTVNHSSSQSFSQFPCLSACRSTCQFVDSLDGRLLTSAALYPK